MFGSEKPFSVTVEHNGKTQSFRVSRQTTPASLKADICDSFGMGADSQVGLRLSEATGSASGVVVPIDPKNLCPNYAYQLVVTKTSPASAVDFESEGKGGDSVFVSEPGTQYVTALWDYKARAPQELSFKKGDLIGVDGQYDEVWWKGVVRNDVGYFPANYVSGLDQIELEDSDSSGDGNLQDDDYFGEYSNLKIHLEMLSDSHRTESYRRAITHLAPFIKGRTVLDVGCGSGVLAIMCAQAGAEHVYGVDASDIIHKATKKVVEENKLADKISLFRGKIEEVELPVKKVDVIISEWMGTFLIAESMLESVLKARDLYLKPTGGGGGGGGVMMPSRAHIRMAPVTDPDFWREKIEFWGRSVHGVRMASLMSAAKEEFLRRPNHLRVA